MSSKSFFARAAQGEGRKAKAGAIIKRERPPMPPLAVRVKVAERQFLVKFKVKGWDVYLLLEKDWSLTRRLRWLLFQLFKIGPDHAVVAPHALDHDPALILRPYNPRIKDHASRYTPHAHDPDALIYREKADHQQKTTGRRPGAARTITTKGSDVGLKTKFARLERKPKTTRFPKKASRVNRTTDSRVKPRLPKWKWPKRKMQTRKP